jgi:hypothetical protein
MWPSAAFATSGSRLRQRLPHAPPLAEPQVNPREDPHWARLATQHDVLSRRRYAALRQRGHSHGRALRTVADRSLSVTCTLLEQQTLFDPAYEGRDAAGA